MAGTYEIPEEGSPNSSQDPKIKTMLTGLNSKLNSSNLLEDTGLASPNNGAYRLLFASVSSFNSEQPAGTYPFAPQGSSPPRTGENFALVTTNYFYFAKADYEVANKTQKLRLRTQVGVNGTKPLLKFTFGLYPITIAGTTTEAKLTLGTVVTGSTIEFNEPAASTFTSKETADFTIPADGAYCVGFVSSATLTTSSNLKFAAQLQTRSV
jgi:hypothetical protein